MFVHKGGVAFSAARAGVDTDALLCVRAGGPYPKRGCLIEGRCINYFTRRCFKVLYIYNFFVQNIDFVCLDKSPYICDLILKAL